MEGLTMNYRKQFSNMFLAQLKMTFRERQTWFWGIFFPVILMVVFMVIFTGGSNDDFEAKVAVVDDSPNEMSRMMLQQIRNMSVFNIESGEPVSLEQAEEWVKEKDVDAAIVFSTSAESGTIRLIVNKEEERGADVQAVSGILDKMVQQVNLAAAGAAPVYELQFEAVSAGDDDLKYEDFLLTGMIALSVAQGGLFGMVGMVEMRRKGLLKRLRMTPARMGLFGLSDVVMRMIFGVFQVVILSLIGVFIFGATLHIHIASLVVCFLIGALTFSAMGYFISSFSKTMEAYMGIANILSFLMMFLSGVFFPLEMMPSWLRPVSHVLPLTYFVDGLRDSMVYAIGPVSADLWIGVGIMVLWGAASFAIGSWIYRSKSIAATR
jgi:ABC-2 type transport system permease protein